MIEIAISFKFYKQTTKENNTTLFIRVILHFTLEGILNNFCFFLILVIGIKNHLNHVTSLAANDKFGVILIRVLGSHCEID